MIITEPGVHEGLDEAVYHGDPVPGGSLSSTGIRKLMPPSCPALYRYYADHPEFSRALDFGSAAHNMVLGTGPRLVLVDARNYQTKKAQQAQAAARAAGHVPVLPHEMTVIEDMADQITDDPKAGPLLAAPGASEVSMFWRDELTGVWCRARADHLAAAAGAGGRLLITDYKTTKSASPDELPRTIHNFGYHVQGAHYLNGVRALGLNDDPAFILIFQEKTPPYLVTVRTLDERALDIAQSKIRAGIERYRDCTASGIWPGYDPQPEIQPVGLPRWAVRAHEWGDD